MIFKDSETMTRDKNARIMLFAKPGGGKTTTMKYLKGKTLLLDIDETSQVLSGLPGFQIANIDPSIPAKEMGDFFKYAQAHAHEFDNIVIDNLTHYQKLWLMEKGETTKSGQPELQHYGVFDSHLLKLISAFNNLDANIIYTAWETTRQIQLENNQLYHQFLPDIRDKLVNHVMGIIPIVARLVKNPETGVRGFLLSESNGTFAKNQLDNREFCLQSEIFNIGDVETNVQVT